MPVVTYRDALNQAMSEEMERDDTVFLMGEEVAEYNGPYKVSQGMLDRFGPRRVVDTPISENGFTGLAVGAAMTGLRPIVEFMSYNFSLVAFDQIISNAAKTMYMSGGQFPIPLVMRGPGGPAAQVSSQHSNCLESMFVNVPGLKVVVPGTPADAKGLLKTAIRDNNPIIFIENELLYGMSGEVPEGEHLVPLGQGIVRAEGTDVTLIAYSRMLLFAEQAREALEKEGISAEIVDPRTLKPLDMALIGESVRKTHRVVVVEEGNRMAGMGAELTAEIQSQCFDDLDAPVVRVTAKENPLPYAKKIEAASLPTVEDIVAAAKQVLYKD
jgi:pyruvate dehydrogenase E1 component beta subunit